MTPSTLRIFRGPKSGIVVSVGTGIVVSVGTDVGVDVGAGEEVGAFVVSAVDVMAVLVSIGVVSAGASFAHELDRISMEAVRIARTLVKRCVFIYLRPFRNVIDWIF